MKQSYIRESEENNSLINFVWALIRRNEAREGRDKAGMQVINLK